MNTPPRSRPTATRDRHRKAIAHGRPPCHICGGDIDYSLPHLDPGAFVVDHIIPFARGGADTLANKAAAHRGCNRAKSDKVALPGTTKSVESSPIW